MKIEELIRKFDMKLATQNGVEGIKVWGNPTAKQVAEIKAKKPEIIAELHRRAEEKSKTEVEEKAAKAAEFEGLKNGNIKIKAIYHDGEYLSGYAVYGQAAELLEKIGIAEYVSGWGYYIRDKVIDDLGEEFEYPQAVEYTRPEREAKEATRKAARTERQAKFDEAARTNKPVELHRYTDKCNDPKEECNLDIITEYAMPDGSLKVSRAHTY